MSFVPIQKGCRPRRVVTTTTTTRRVTCVGSDSLALAAEAASLEARTGTPVEAPRVHPMAEDGRRHARSRDVGTCSG